VVADAQKLKDAFEPKSLVVIQLKYADPKTLNDILGLVLASDKVRVDTRTNQVIIYGSQDEVTRAKLFIDSVDVPIQQVAILTRIEEISSDGLKDLGIEWSFPSLQVSFQQGSMGISLDYETGLKALEEKDLATTLARPGITTLDGNEASIMLGDRVPVKEEITVDNKTTTTVEFIDVGVKLKFLPRVNKDGRITVKMSPEISSITGKSADGYPQISTRNVETVINIRNGETVAIGGLLQHQEIENISKIPLLGSIPLVGTLFSTKKKDIKDSEVVIFVTTYLINPEETVNLYKTMPETVKTPIPADKNAEGQANEVHASKQ
jgi:type IV pilus assembly protein PilQ